VRERERNKNRSIAIKKRIRTSAAVIPMRPTIYYLYRIIYFLYGFFTLFFSSGNQSFHPEILRRQYCLAWVCCPSVVRVMRFRESYCHEKILSCIYIYWKCCHIIIVQLCYIKRKLRQKLI
jgi:hypothetical protein